MIIIVSMEYQHNLKYYPHVDRALPLVDQAGKKRMQHHMEHQYDGSPFNLYNHSGHINKGLPLTFRPPVDKVLSSFRGDFINSSQNPTFYGCNSCFGNILIPPNQPYVPPETAFAFYS